MGDRRPLLAVTESHEMEGSAQDGPSVSSRLDGRGHPGDSSSNQAIRRCGRREPSLPQPEQIGLLPPHRHLDRTAEVKANQEQNSCLSEVELAPLRAYRKTTLKPALETMLEATLETAL